MSRIVVIIMERRVRHHFKCISISTGSQISDHYHTYQKDKQMGYRSFIFACLLCFNCFQSSLQSCIHIMMGVVLWKGKHLCTAGDELCLLAINKERNVTFSKFRELNWETLGSSSQCLKKSGLLNEENSVLGRIQEHNEWVADCKIFDDNIYLNIIFLKLSWQIEGTKISEIIRDGDMN